jgi:hypothetical protein
MKKDLTILILFGVIAIVFAYAVVFVSIPTHSSPSEEAHVVVHSLWDGQKQYFKIDPKKSTHSIDFRNVYGGQESITVNLNSLPSVYKFRTPTGSYEYEIYWISSTQKSQTKWMKEHGASGPQLPPSEEERMLRQTLKQLMETN